MGVALLTISIIVLYILVYYLNNLSTQLILSALSTYVNIGDDIIDLASNLWGLCSIVTIAFCYSKFVLYLFFIFPMLVLFVSLIAIVIYHVILLLKK